MPKTMTATQTRMHFGDVMRQIVENGDPVIVERAGKPQVAMVSLADFERLCESRAGELLESIGIPVEQIWHNYSRSTAKKSCLNLRVAN